VERHPERAAQIAANRNRYGVDNLKVVSGQARSVWRTCPLPTGSSWGAAGYAERHHPGSPAAPGAGSRVVVTAALLETWPPPGRPDSGRLGG